MLTEPASNTSVPLTVVMRTLSRVPDKVTLPPPEDEPPSIDLPTPCVATHTFEPNVARVIMPPQVFPAAPVVITMPAVESDEVVPIVEPET